MNMNHSNKMKYYIIHNWLIHHLSIFKYPCYLKRNYKLIREYLSLIFNETSLIKKKKNENENENKQIDIYPNEKLFPKMK